MAKKSSSRKNPSKPKPKPRCGLVMPISDTPNCPESHWRDVKAIFVDALKSKFETELVSEEPEVNIIHSKIVNNLHDNPLVVVDISELNANVMFELGLRLAFDKPTVLVKDDKTEWKFDISPLETLEYPRDLRHSTILNFKKELANKALASHKKREEEGEAYSCYLQHFKKIERKSIPTEQVGDMELLLSKLNAIEHAVSKKPVDDALRKLWPSERARKYPKMFLVIGQKSSIFEMRENLQNKGTSCSVAARTVGGAYKIKVLIESDIEEAMLSFEAKTRGLKIKND